MADKLAAKAAKQHIEEYFQQADAAYEENPTRAHRYAELAWKMALKHRIRLSGEQRKQLCKSCHHFLKEGKNSRFRTRNGKIILTCLDCGGIRRIVYRV